MNYLRKTILYTVKKAKEIVDTFRAILDMIMLPIKPINQRKNNKEKQ